ncbi:methyl-accepting chemotaxis protein [Methylobrevis albus]|uniref:Methyl-accepting transducer domain-containing protein n=1 Tax=Methylobrevis albus TaxID=2793297 RepID=A0A931MYE6_9HYPH|nr:methyl-accepting chemotaxis protein [Methylobrevis albus]MBH0236636.1 hypothetical protein [Methylobrevis albus]
MFRSNNAEAKVIEKPDAERFAEIAAAHKTATEALQRQVETLTSGSQASLKHAVDTSVNISELLCLMAWSSGNVHNLSGETVAVSAAIEEVAKSIENIADLSGRAQGQSAEAHAIVEAGAARAMSAGRAMQDIAEAFTGLDRQMHQLGGAIESIGGFAKQIESISSQTKLLALNATIEAARAGEAGRGFAVVAAEVKALSEETSRTTELIRGQLTGLADVMQGMLHAMSIGGTKVRDGRETFDVVATDMASIRDCVSDVNASIGAIAGMLGDQQSATEAMAKSMSEIARLAGQNETDVKASSELIIKTDAITGKLIDAAGEAGVARYAERRLRADHMAWKRRLAECLVGLKPIELTAFSARVEPLGPHFATITDPAVRRLSVKADKAAAEALRMVKEVAAGRMNVAIEAYMAMDGASGEIMAALADLERAN